MIFTIGRTESYDQNIASQENCQKKGKDQNYCGGSVWRTYEEALEYVVEGYSVYGVVADWDKDTEENQEGGNWHNLLKDAKLIKISGEDGK